MIHINNVHSDTLGYEMNVTQHSVHRINNKVSARFARANCSRGKRV